MRFNLSLKIAGLVVCALAFMAVAALLSVRQSSQIMRELDLVGEHYAPMLEAVAMIDGSVMKQGEVLQRLFVMVDGDLPQRELDQGLDAFSMIGTRAAQMIKDAEGLLVAIPDNAALQENLGTISVLHHDFEEQGTLLLALRSGGDRQSFDVLLPDFDVIEEGIVQSIAEMRHHLEMLNDESVARAELKERSLLAGNVILTALAALFGLGFAFTATRGLRAGVRNLKHGMKAAEEGNLSTEIRITSRDEIGDLTRSFNQMTAELTIRQKIRKTFGKYMDPKIVSELVDQPERMGMDGEQREMTVMFIDLKGFKEISDKLDPEDLIELLDQFYSHMTTAIGGQQGVVDKFMGGVVMAYWGRPFCSPDRHATLACQAALDVFDHLEDFQGQAREKLGRKARGLDIDFRIGISTGDVVTGMLGKQTLDSYTIIGEPIGIASRLEDANKAYGSRIIISNRTRQLAGGDILVRELDLIEIKGSRAPTRIYELLSLADEADDDLIISREQFQMGLHAYRKREWDAAEAAFVACLEEKPNDSASQIYLDRIAYLRKNPPPAGWKGTWVF